ncbi:MAG: hypothetical protein ACYC9R_06355 [Nitrosotalea sp.]
MPSSPGYKRNYQQENKYKSSPKQIKEREIRNTNRREALAKGTVHKGDNKQIDHIKPLSKGGAPAGKNLRIESAHANDSFRRNSKAGMVENKPYSSYQRKRKYKQS